MSELDLDLEGVDPLRRSAIRDRIRLAIAYIDANIRDRSVATDYAEQLGLSYASFMRLIQIWKQHKDPSKLHGAGANRRKDRPYQREMPADTKRLVEQVIEEAGTQVRLVDLVRLVNARCAQEGILTANRSTVNWMLMKARSKVGHAKNSRGILIGSCQIKLPVLANDSTIMPHLMMAVEASTGEIVATDFAIEPDAEKSLKIVLAKLKSADHIGCGKNVTLPAGSKITATNDLAEAHITFSPFRNSQEVGMVLGRSIAGIGLLFRQKGTLPAADLLKTPEDRALSPEEACGVIESAIQRHNVARRAQHQKAYSQIAA